MGSVVSNHQALDPERTALKSANALLLVLALILLIAGFPFLLFGAFLALIETQDVIPGGGYFAVGGLAALLCGLGIKQHLKRRDR
jgi:hypothetical protein